MAALLASVVSTPLSAQATGRIEGTVTDARTQQPLAASAVTIQGTKLGTVTGDDGKYVLPNIEAGAHTLVVRRIGYGSTSKPVTVVAGQAATADFQLSQVAVSLDQVVVTGTAVASRKKEVGNSVGMVSADQIKNAPVVNSQDVLAGRVASVTVLSNSGQPGAGGSVMIRGTNTISQSTYPLIYIDGVRVFNEPTRNGWGGRNNTNPLQNINANDIDHIEVVKGAAATTLYGTEAAGGVIQIFTKKGRSGAPAWDLDVTQGFNQSPHWGAKGDPTNLWVDCNNSALMYGLNLKTGEKKPFTDPTCPSDGNWTTHGQIQRYGVSVRGGSDNVKYFVSGNYDQNAGMLPTQLAKNGGVRANMTFSPSDKLSFTMSSAYTKLDNRWVGDGNNSEGFLLDVGRATASYLKGGKGHDCDAVPDDVICVTNGYVFDQNNTTGSDHYLVGFTTNYAPLSNWNNKFSVGWDYTAIRNVTNLPFGFLDTPLGYFWDENTRHTKLSLDYTGSLQNDLGKSLASTFSWGGQLFRDRHRWTEIDVQNFAGPVDPTLETGAQLTYRADIPFAETNAGFFLQEQLAWRDRLFVTGGVRVDGNSAFGDNFGLQVYPKLSLAYALSDYDWFPKAFDAFKLRMAVGSSGKAPGAFDKLKSWQAETANEGDPGVRPDAIGNPDVGPERTQEIEMGFDAGLFQGRLGVEATVFQATTRDALVPVTLPPSGGFLNSRIENIGKLRNRGVEAQLNGSFIRTADFEWSARANLTFMQSKALDLGEQTEVYTGLNSYIKEGDAFPAFYGKVILNPNEIADPVIANDTIIGNVNPDKLWGFGTTFTFKNSLTLDAFFEHQGGFYVQNYTAYQNARRGVWYPCYAAQEAIAASFGPDHKSNTADDDPSALNGVTALERARCSGSDYDIGFWTEKGDFTKLRYVTLTYQLPENLVSRFFGAEGASVSLSGRNLFTWSNYQGGDPEVEDFTDQANLVGTAGRFGRRDYYMIPSMRSYSLAIHLNF
jgi:TonB-linked SusC/RagA family outer membrane protein